MEEEYRQLRNSLLSKTLSQLKLQRGQLQSKINYHVRLKGRNKPELEINIEIVRQEIVRRRTNLPPPDWADPLPIVNRPAQIMCDLEDEKQELLPIAAPVVYSVNTEGIAFTDGQEDEKQELLPIAAPVVYSVNTEGIVFTDGQTEKHIMCVVAEPEESIPGTVALIENVELPLSLCSSMDNIYNEFTSLVSEFKRLELEPHEDDDEVSESFAKRTTHINHVRNMKNPSVYSYSEVLHHDLSVELMGTKRILRDIKEEINLTKQLKLQDKLNHDLLLVSHLEGTNLLVPDSFSLVANSELSITKKQLEAKFSHFPIQAHEDRRKNDLIKSEGVVYGMEKHIDDIQNLQQELLHNQQDSKQSFDHLEQCVISDKYPLEKVMYRQFCLCRICVERLPELKNKLVLPLPLLPTLSSIPAKREIKWTDHAKYECTVDVAEEFYDEFMGCVSDKRIGEIVYRETVPDTKNLLKTFTDQVYSSCNFLDRHDVFYPLGLDPKLVNVEVWVRFLFTYSRNPPKNKSVPHVYRIFFNHDQTMISIHMTRGPINKDEVWIRVKSKQPMLQGVEWKVLYELQQDRILNKPNMWFHVPVSFDFIDEELDEQYAAEALEDQMVKEAVSQKTTVEALARRSVTQIHRVVEIINGREVTQESTVKTVHQLKYRVENMLCRRRREYGTLQKKWNEAYGVFLKDKEFSTSGANGLKKHIYKGKSEDEEKKRKSRENANMKTTSSGPFKSHEEKEKENLNREIRSLILDFRQNVENCEREVRRERLVELETDVLNFLYCTKDEVRTIGLQAIKGNDWKTLSELAIMSDGTISESGVIQIFPGPLGRLTAPASWKRHCEPKLISEINQKLKNTGCTFHGLHDKNVKKGIGVRRSVRKLKDARQQARDVENQLTRDFAKMYIVQSTSSAQKKEDMGSSKKSKRLYSASSAQKKEDMEPVQPMRRSGRLKNQNLPTAASIGKSKKRKGQIWIKIQ